MIGFTVAVLLAAGPPANWAPVGRDGGSLKARHPMTPAEEEAEAARIWETSDKNLGVPDAGPPIPPFHWKVSNIIREIPIDGIQVAMDVPVKLHAVLVKGRVQDVLEEMINHFEASHLYMQPIEQQPQVTRQLQVTALDHDRAISYTAMIDELADGTCMVVLGEGNLGMAAQTQRERRMQGVVPLEIAPLMPNATSPTRASTEGLKTLTYLVKSSEAAVKKFYQDELKKQGYTESEPNVFRRGSRELSLTIKRQGEQLGVMLTEGPAAAP